jgi:hypothetical protein
MATAERATKNLDLELDRFKDFSRDIIAPILSDIALSGSRFHPKTEVTVRSINDSYGYAASKVFSLMFKKLVRGNQDKSGKGYKSSWLPYDKALFFYNLWVQSTTEKTARSLYNYLAENGCEPVEWIPQLKIWATSDLAKQIRDARAETEAQEEKYHIDYSKLYEAMRQHSQVGGAR